MGAIDMQSGNNNAVYVGKPKSNDVGKKRLIGYANGVNTDYSAITGKLTKAPAYFGKDINGNKLNTDSAFTDISYQNSYDFKDELVICISDGIEEQPYYVIRMDKYRYNTLFFLNGIIKSLRKNVNHQLIFYCKDRVNPINNDRLFNIAGGAFDGKIIKDSLYSVEDMQGMGLIKYDKTNKAAKAKAESKLIEVIDTLVNEIKKMTIINDEEIFTIEDSFSYNNNNTTLNQNAYGNIEADESDDDVPF